MKRHFMLLLCLSLLYASVFGMAVSADDSITVRVGIYENSPKIFTDDKGNASGFWPDIIEYIASEEGWKIEYIHGTWPQCLNRLERNEIDIMPDVAYTEERSGLYDYSNETVYTSWSRVYTREGADIQSIFDLEGKNIALLKGSVNVEGPDGIKELVREFNINCTFIEVDSYIRVFELVESGEADAGVANRDFYYQQKEIFDIVRTSIIFQPASLYFAFPKESSLTPYLTERIDYHMKELKEDEDSIYYQSLEKWLGVKPIEKSVIPGWIKWALIGIGGLAIMLAGGSFLLRAQVRSKTKELTEEIAERKQAEEKLRDSEEKYRLLAENVTDVIFVQDMNLNMTYASPSATPLFGYSVEEASNLKMKDILTPDSLAKAMDSFQKLAALAGVKKDIEIPPMEYEYVRKDGSTFWGEIRVTFLRDSESRPVAVQGLLRDITQRKQAEEQIKHAASEWRTTFDSIIDLVSIHDKDFRLIRVNKAFADVCKMKPEEIIGKHCYEVIHGATKPVPNCPHRKTLETKKWATGDFFEPHLGISLEVSTSPIFDEKGEMAASVHVARDITERKKMQEQLIITDRLASVGELASGIAHELNNPLTGVIGFSELLLEKDIPDDIKEDLKVINSEAVRTANIVKNLLAFARKHPQEKHPVDINKVIQEVLKLRAYEERVQNIEVNTQFAPDLPEVVANGFQLQQVFLNIIMNAEYFMIAAHGRGTLTITTERMGNIIRASFADDGPGIAEENMGHLFNLFFTTKGVGKGTGLGLSICHRTVADHGGRIYAESELGKGATFIVEIPVNK